MTTANSSTNTNDFVLAKLLNNTLLTIITFIRKAEEMDLPEDYEIDELNRAYVLLVNELENLYEHNPKLAEIRPEPFWKQFDVLKTVSWRLLDYLNDPELDKGQAHIRKLDKLCIISGSESAELSPKLQELTNNAFEAIIHYRQKLDDARLDINQKIEESWYIPKYWLDYTDGTILINDVLKLKKTHIGSTIDQLLEQAFKNQNTLFTPTLPATARNLSTVLSSAGFTPVLRQLFFPTISMRKGALFRPAITFEQATREDIETTELDLLLKLLDADHTFSA